MSGASETRPLPYHSGSIPCPPVDEEGRGLEDGGSVLGWSRDLTYRASSLWYSPNH